MSDEENTPVTDETSTPVENVVPAPEPAPEPEAAPEPVVDMKETDSRKSENPQTVEIKTTDA